MCILNVIVAYKCQMIRMSNHTGHSAPLDVFNTHAAAKRDIMQWNSRLGNGWSFRRNYLEGHPSYTLEDERLEPTAITHEKKRERNRRSEPNLHGIMFQPLIFRGVGCVVGHSHSKAMKFGHFEGVPPPCLRDLLTMPINHLLHGMILQVCGGWPVIRIQAT